MANCGDVQAMIEALRTIFVDDGTMPRNFLLDRSPIMEPPNLANDAIFEIPLSYTQQPEAQEARDTKTEVRTDGAANKKVFTRPAKLESAVPISKDASIGWSEPARTRGSSRSEVAIKATATQWTKQKRSVRAFGNNDVDEFFAPKPIVLAPSSSVSGIQNWLLRQKGGGSSNPFGEFVKYSAETQQAPGKQVTKLEIFFFFQSESDRRRSCTIKVLGNPTIRDTIGYILYEYTRQNRQPAVKLTPAAYKLFLHDECGEPFSDFPALDEKERLLKFDFDTLVLCENESFKADTGSTQTVVKGDIVDIRYDICKPAEESSSGFGSTTLQPQRLAAGSTKLPITTLELKLKSIIEQTIKRRLLRPSCEYGIRKADNADVDLDVDLALKDIPRPYEFIIYRKHTRRAALSSAQSAKAFTLIATKTKLAYDLTIETNRVLIIIKKSKHLFKSPKQLSYTYDEVRCSPGSDDKCIIINEVEYEAPSPTVASEVVHLIALKQ